MTCRRLTPEEIEHADAAFRQWWLSVLTLGLFVLVINALMLLFVAWLVPGFYVAGFWTGFFVSLFISVFSFILNSLLGYNKVTIRRIE